MRRIKFLSDNIITIFTLKFHNNEMILYNGIIPYYKTIKVKNNIYQITHFWNERNSMWFEENNKEKIELLDL